MGLAPKNISIMATPTDDPIMYPVIAMNHKYGVIGIRAATDIAGT